jgi:hypothetical protein
MDIQRRNAGGNAMINQPFPERTNHGFRTMIDRFIEEESLRMQLASCRRQLQTSTHPGRIATIKTEILRLETALGITKPVEAS